MAALRNFQVAAIANVLRVWTAVVRDHTAKGFGQIPHHPGCVNAEG